MKLAQVNVYPHEIGRDLIPELATRVYSSQLDSFREAISNAFDEDSKQVELTITRDKIVIEDWGNGIRDYDEFRKFGQASKKQRQGEIIGEKGLGKLSLLNLGNSVCFETNNGRMGIQFHMNLTGFSKPVYGKNKSFLAHKGTRITITQITNKVEINAVLAYVKKAFGLRLAQGAKISLNGDHIYPKSNLDPKESQLFILEKSEAKVTGNLKADKEGKGIVDIYIDHVFVASVEADTRRNFIGWVNCNRLTPETSRNNIVQNNIYKEFMVILRKYVSRFPLKDIATIDKRKLLLSRELSAMLKRYIKDMKISVNNKSNQDTMHFDAFSHDRLIGASKKGATSKTLRLVRSNPAKSPLGLTNTAEKNPDNSSNSNSVRWEYADLGNEKEPMYFVPPNTIYCNMSNDLFQFALTKNRYYGPTWVRMLPYLARIAVEINNKESFRLPPDEFNLKVDEAARYFLKQKKVIN
jgi:histidine kinase/DNA gyrase B/HSP90-like ATPase